MKHRVITAFGWAMLTAPGFQAFITSGTNQRTNSSPLSDKTALHMERREWLRNGMSAAGLVVYSMMEPVPSASALSTASAAEVTSKVYVDIKGLPTTEGTPSTGTQRIVIGLFGKDAPNSVEKLVKLMSPQGLPALCKPRGEKLLQREQLEANKVYNSCIEGQDKGVNYDYAQIWRIVKGERIDFGSVAGRFVARENPTWGEDKPNGLRNDRPGMVSVRKGADSGFSFTIYPGGSSNTIDLDQNQIVVGQVLEGLDVVEALNNVPVVKAAKVNYMGLTGGPRAKDAPTRSCLYGGPMYCNEDKPLIKLTMYQTGVL
ncbi:cyclophilin type peptidyl-prolyl cis-trans isomerase [Nitzschia inconspicua]|uniref:Cyclophilin type peptidyl-prolyl cis-trans isomerase n=1 Tax=Nitzschia inconspicua TaxID=303405 RepID=A0A9K3LS83_9STRA|nr:cyclophilin type peptidyl-prolyl cis-trans isomerase [Nitzschia inconspicua]